MLPTVNHYPVNWVDGMRVSSQQFTQDQNFVYDHLRDNQATGLTSYNYGLFASGGSEDFSLLGSIDALQNLHVTLFNFRAVTAGGCRIDIKKFEKIFPLGDVLTLHSIPQKDGKPLADNLNYLVVLSVNLFERHPEGEPYNEQGFQPFQQPTYELLLLPKPQQLSIQFESAQLIVGLLDYQNGYWTLKKDYIPACTSVGAHPQLQDWAVKMKVILTDIQANAIEIVKRVCQQRGNELRRYDIDGLAEMIGDFCIQVADHLNPPVNYLQFTGFERPPIYAIEVITLAARKLQTTLASLNPGIRLEDLLSHAPMSSFGYMRTMGKETIQKYFWEQTNITSETLDSRLQKLTLLPYNHNSIQPQLQLIMECWQDWDAILKRLITRDFIGQSKDQIII